ncbi:hypothetical protein JAAARDRAFT_185480 [Jaapia argillacea MUCL 33604]|uniref:Efficient mitochondria targeting-associated protein 19 n=1 Tax=Jaapia argillacea MUCL 33604 TaxID=933084 RepID=A0A067PKN9_9AGAM|nr:hypothetical protein JAAARDRAFT_185480 [Jaapia argillacea MUCL 33604]
MARIPLTSRPMDMVYFLFFLSHIPASLLMDLQVFYPSWFPSFIRTIPAWYINYSGDPLVAGFMGLSGKSESWIWLKTFLFLEAFFQVPTFFLGARGLYKNNPSIYLLILIYGASTATTTLPCLTVLLSTPISEAPVDGLVTITSEQRLMLLSSYIPFFIIPLTMAVDMSFRILKLVRKGAGVEVQKKRK